MRSIAPAVDDSAFRQTRTSGGSSDTEVNALTVTPHGGSSPDEVTTVTPVGQARNARRNRSDCALPLAAVAVRAGRPVRRGRVERRSAADLRSGVRVFGTTVNEVFTVILGSVP